MMNRTGTEAHDHVCPECGRWLKNCTSAACEPYFEPGFGGPASRDRIVEPEPCQRCKEVA